MKSKTRTKIEIVICIIGLLLLLYPFVSNYWNSKYASRVIIEYENSVEKIDNDDYEKIKKEVTEYNNELSKKGEISALTESEKEKYYSLLNMDDKGTIGYVEIDAIKVKLPICHGTSDNVLQNSVGHLEWSSLPIGGESTHSVFSAHTGLKSARLFTDLPKLKIGDKFIINVLKENLVYEVDQIKVVKPEDLNDLKIIEGEDYATLTTCTPYGVNTDRLLVRGHRVIDKEKIVNIVSNAKLINKYIVALFLCIIPLLIFVISVIFKK